MLVFIISTTVYSLLESNNNNEKECPAKGRGKK